MKKYIKYFITVGVGLVLALIVANAKDLFAQTGLSVIYQILSDCFLIPGVVIAGMGLLLFASNEGVFDGISYGFKVIAQMFKRKPTPVKQSYFEYREEKGRNKLTFGFLLICGAAFFAVSIIFLILYSSVT